MIVKCYLQIFSKNFKVFLLVKLYKDVLQYDLTLCSLYDLILLISPIPALDGRIIWNHILWGIIYYYEAIDGTGRTGNGIAPAGGL